MKKSLPQLSLKIACREREVIKSQGLCVVLILGQSQLDGVCQSVKIDPPQPLTHIPKFAVDVGETIFGVWQLTTMQSANMGSRAMWRERERRKSVRACKMMRSTKTIATSQRHVAQHPNTKMRTHTRQKTCQQRAPQQRSQQRGHDTRERPTNDNKTKKQKKNNCFATTTPQLENT